MVLLVSGIRAVDVLEWQVQEPRGSFLLPAEKVDGRIADEVGAVGVVHAEVGLGDVVVRGGPSLPPVVPGDGGQI